VACGRGWCAGGWQARGRAAAHRATRRDPPDSSPPPLPPLQVHKAVITETAKETRRADGTTLRFARNACVLLNAKRAPLGTRVLGFATHELRARGLVKVLSLAARVL
jgi:hypothetical protein